MKKIIYTLLVAVMALSFMGCPTVNSDLPPQLDLSGLYFKGSFDGFGDGVPLVKQSDGTWKAEFTANGSEVEFKIATKDWATAYPFNANNECPVMIIGDEVEFFAGDSGFANPKITGLVKDNKYTVLATPQSTSIKVKITGDAVTPPAAEEEEEEEAVLVWPPLALPMDCFAVKVEGLSSDGEKTWESSISWGGAVGTWAGKDYVKGTSAITVDVIDGAGVMYISNDFAIDGWAVDQKVGDTNLKLKTGDGPDRWFKIEKPAEGYCVINWEDGAQ